MSSPDFEDSKKSDSPQAIRSSPSLRFSIYDGIAWALMVGFGETFLGAYAIFLGASPTYIALLGAFPAFIPAFSQMFGLKVLSVFPSRRNLTTFAASMQALSWLPLAAVGLLLTPQSNAPLMLLLFASIYFFFAGLGAPAWSSLIGDLVPNDRRGAYFGLRNRRIGHATLLALVVSGPILAAFQSAGYSAFGFATLFITAGCCRLISAFWLSKHEDPPLQPAPNAYFSFLEFLRRTPYSNFTKFAIFVSLINGALSICGPFFSLFILRELQFSYAEFTILCGCMIAAQILTLQHWGRLSDRFGNKAILFVAAPGITLAPLLWLVSNSFIWMIFIHVYSGFLWAGFNLSASNFLFDAVTPAKRARCAAYQSILNGFAIISGSLAGSYFLSHPLPILREYFGDHGHVMDYYLLFISSFLIRVLVVSYFFKLIKEVREVEVITHKDLIFKVMQVRALSGITFGFNTRKKKDRE